MGGLGADHRLAAEDPLPADTDHMDEHIHTPHLQSMYVGRRNACEYLVTYNRCVCGYI